MLVAAPGAFVVQRRSRSGDEVDYDAALEAMIDRRSGASTSDAIYESLRRERRDVAVGILIDVSSSTAERVPGAEPLWSSPTLDHLPGSGRRPPRILDLEILSSLLCMAALDSVGDRFAAWTFSGTGRERVVVSVLKGFDEPFDGRVVSRAAAVKPMHATRMGAAIRHCTARMRAARATTNVLIVLSDGRPTDIDYGTEYGDDGSLRYALADTARALGEARKQGIRPYLLTVDVTGEDYLGDLGTVDAEVLCDLNVLPERLTGLYRHLTDSGSTR
jgi:nitric oxide reductase activation protein